MTEGGSMTFRVFKISKIAGVKQFIFVSLITICCLHMSLAGKKYRALYSLEWFQWVSWSFFYKVKKSEFPSWIA